MSSGFLGFRTFFVSVQHSNSFMDRQKNKSILRKYYTLRISVGGTEHSQNQTDFGENTLRIVAAVTNFLHDKR